MKVKELIARLCEFPPSTDVLFSSDEEGNIKHQRAEIILTENVYPKRPERLAVVIYPLNSEADI